MSEILPTNLTALTISKLVQIMRRGELPGRKLPLSDFNDGE